MTQPLSIEEAAAELGRPVAHVRAVAQGTIRKGRDRLPIPAMFEVRRVQLQREFEGHRMSVERRELWGDDRLLWAIEHSFPIA